MATVNEDLSGEHETVTEVRYGETDKMGYAHHGAALLWFELGRVDWLRKYGLSYRQMEQDGLMLPVVEVNIRYHQGAAFEDQIVIHSRLADVSKMRVKFDNRVYRVEPAGSRTLLISGSVGLVCVNAQRRVCRVPPMMETLWEQIKATRQDKR